MRYRFFILLLLTCFVSSAWSEIIFNNAVQNGLTDEGLITGPRIGGGFYSEVQVGNSIAGFTAVQSSNRVGDNFTIDRHGVQLQEATVYAYQTNATTATISNALVRIRRGGAIGPIVATGTFVSSRFTSIYRIFNGQPDTARRIQQVSISFNDVELVPDNYFISIELTGSGGFSGPFVPPLTKVGAVTLPGADGLSQSGTAAWTNLVDGANRQEVPFILEGIQCASKLYAYDVTTRQIHEINPVNAEATLYATLPSTVPTLSGFSYDAYRGDIYAISSTADATFKVDPLSGSVVSEGPLLLTPSPVCHGIETDRGNNYGSASSSGGDRFFFIDGPSGNAFVRGNMGFGNSGFNNFGFNLNSTIMYMTNSSTDSLYTVNYSTGATTLVGPLNGPTNPQSMAYYPDTGQMFLTESNGNLWRVNMSNGACTLVGDISLTGSWLGLYCVNQEVGRPSSFAITGGVLFGGNTSSLGQSDDNKLYMLCDESNSNGIMEFIIQYCDADWYAINLTAETSATRTDLTEFFELFNNDTNSFQSFFSLTRSTSLVDSVFGTNIVNIGTTTRWVTPAGTLRGRMRYVPQSDLEAADGWSIAIDQVNVDRAIRS